MKWSKLSHTGLVRKNNEDNSCVCDDLRLLAVADGMGGHKAGETASTLALEAMAGILRNDPDLLAENPVEALQTAFKHANETVFNFSREQGEEFRGMGTTVAAVLERDGRIFVAHVGDSRVYLVRGDEIKLLTSDHSLVNELLKSGSISEEEAVNHPQRNVLTRAVGTSDSVEVDVNEVTVTNGDMIILCTDGLSNLVNLDEIKQMAGQSESLAERAERFIAMALERGGDDNITVILLQVE